MDPAPSGTAAPARVLSLPPHRSSPGPALVRNSKKLSGALWPRFLPRLSPPHRWRRRAAGRRAPPAVHHHGQAGPHRHVYALRGHGSLGQAGV